MLDVMYEIPSNDKISQCIITKDSILGKERPKLVEGERKAKDKKDSPLRAQKGDIENAS